MKAVLIALFAVVAVSQAQYLLPSYGLGLGSHLVSPLAYSAHVVAAAPVAVAPAIQSGYVAATRGSVHTAPLPTGPFSYSHHINTAPAPGTF